MPKSNNTVAINILNTITELKFQKTVEEFMILREIKNISSRRRRYHRNPNLPLLQPLDSREAALFLSMLLSYWYKKGLSARDLHISCYHNVGEPGFEITKGDPDCPVCCSLSSFMKQLFGEEWRELPFIKSVSYSDGHALRVTANALREFAYT